MAAKAIDNPAPSRYTSPVQPNPSMKLSHTLAALFAVVSFANADEKEIFNGKDLTGWEGNKDLWSVKDGTITGGMIPKVETCIYALERGVEAVVILDGKVPHAVLLELLTDHGAGTLIKR